MLPSPMSDAQPISAAHNGTAQASRQTAFGRSSMALACPMDRSPPTHSEPERPRKRLRTRKACAYCKARKIRCDFDGSSRPGDPCKRCQTYGLACDVVCEVDHPRGRPVSLRRSRQPHTRALTRRRPQRSPARAPRPVREVPTRCYRTMARRIRTTETMPLGLRCLPPMTPGPSDPGRDPEVSLRPRLPFRPQFRRAWAK